MAKDRIEKAVKYKWSKQQSPKNNIYTISAKRGNNPPLLKMPKAQVMNRQHCKWNIRENLISNHTQILNILFSTLSMKQVYTGLLFIYAVNRFFFINVYYHILKMLVSITRNINSIKLIFINSFSNINRVVN